MDPKNFAILFLVASFVSLSLCGACTHPVYCTGPLLDAVQRARIFNDSKTFVDMPMKYPPAEILMLFNRLPSNFTPQELLAFVEQNFYPAGSDLVDVNPVDWLPNPSFVNKINNTLVREFAQAIHSKWRVLVRAWNSTFCPECHSHLPVGNPFVIAGSRFREFYYWDSYWTIHGLIVSGMLNTTKGLLQNFLDLVKELGFLPNGGRIYYLNRSQPPLLTQMINEYYAATSDYQFLQQAVPILDLEYQYWMSNTTVEPVPGYILNRYYVVNDSPRPESYFEDVTLVETVSPSDAAFLYQQIATGAETGWDFSSRWMEHEPNLATLITTEKVPVDLNSILYKNELVLSNLYTILKQKDKSTLYSLRAQQRLKAINAVLWNNEAGIWNDRYLNGSFDARFYASNIVPFWAGAYTDLSSHQIWNIVNNLSQELSYPGGFPTSILQTGQQWDFPNGWAPLQYFAIVGLNNIANTKKLDPTLQNKCSQTAFQLSSKWFTSNFCAWNVTGMIFEKFDVTTRGLPGGGGEYVVQDGFGWTNGLALYLIQSYGNSLKLLTCGH